MGTVAIHFGQHHWMDHLYQTPRAHSNGAKYWNFLNQDESLFFRAGNVSQWQYPSRLGDL
jgi:hypothetical protein